MDFLILGPLEVVRDGVSVKLGGPRQQTVLAMLLLEGGKAVPVDRLIDAVWEGDPPATARDQIQICISTLRRTVVGDDGGELIQTQSPGYRLILDGCSVDGRVFDARVREGRQVLADGDPAAAVSHFRQALRLWRGAALSSVASTLVQLKVAQLNERRLSVLEECMDAELSAGLDHDLAAELATLVQENPLRERFRGLLMRALYGAGRQAEALEEYRLTRSVLMDELGVEPNADLQRLHQMMLAGEPVPEPVRRPVAAAAGTGGPRSAAVGDQGGPPADSPAGSAPGATAGAAAGQPPAAPRRRTPMLLPAAIPDFTGRSSMVGEILATMSEAAAAGQALPIAVLYGRGGAGKTSLAVELAHRMAAGFPDGQLFAQMQSGARGVDPAEILGRFLQALGVGGGVMPSSLEERAETYRDLLGKRRMLIVLDNVVGQEQVLPLLPGSARCAVLVTSRRRLANLPAVVRAEVGPLSRHSAVALLTRIVGAERAEAEPEATDRLCELCGYLPLVLRVVAARLVARPHWSIASLVDRLADESHRLDELNYGDMGVRASLTLSYDALSEPARRLFRLLAVSHAPSFAAWVGAPLLQIDPLRAEELLEELTEAYLLDTEAGSALEPVRYRFHDITRQFAQEQMMKHESPQERREALKRLMGALLFLTEGAHRREYSGDYLLPSSDARRWELPAAITDRALEDPMSWYELERLSILAGVRQAAAGGLVDHAWSLALNAVTLFESHSHFSDWKSTHETALKAACQAGDRRGEAAMRYSLGSLYMVERKNGMAARQFDQAGALYAQLDDPHGAALVLRYVAFLDRLNGELELAQTRWEQALGMFQVVGDRIAEAYVLHNMAQIKLDYGDHDAAQELLARGAVICEETGNRRVGAQVHNRLGALHFVRGEYEQAAEMYGRVLESARASGDRIGECHALLGLSSVDLRLGAAEHADQVLTGALELAQTVGDRMVESRVVLALAEAKLAVGEIECAAGYADQAVGDFAETGARQMEVRALITRGLIHRAAGAPDKAMGAWRYASVLLSREDLKHAVALREELDGYVSELESDPPER